MNSRILVFTVFLAQLVVGEDFFWKPNNNWNNPSNWDLGRVPCGGDIASVPDNSIIYLSEDINVKTIMLPINGQIILKPSVAINLVEDADCGDGMNVEQPTDAIGSTNEFVGAVPRWWECSENWLNEDNFPAEHPPCGDDRAIFEQDSYFSFVRANQTISVSYLEVRGNQIQSSDELGKNEFQLDIEINPECVPNPSLCPCPPDAGCIAPLVPVTGPQTGDKGPNVAGIVTGILFALLVVIVITTLLIVLAVLMYRKYKRTGGYKKDDFLEETAPGEITYEEQPNPKTSSTLDSRTFDNPLYDSTTVTPSGIQLTGYETKPKLDFKASDPAHALDDNSYEIVQDILQPDSNNDDTLVKVDLGALGDLGDNAPVVDVYEPQSDSKSQSGNEQEKKRKGKKGSKYEQFS